MKNPFQVLFLLALMPLLTYCNQAPDNNTGQASDSLKKANSNQPSKDSLSSSPEPVTDIPEKYLLGRYDAANDTLFREIEVPVANRSGLFLRKEALEAFQKMRKAAAKDDINLKIVSAFRSFRHQKWIWNAKFQGNRRSGGLNMKKNYPDPKERVEAILNYSAMPGTSRHHWGTDIDINSVNSSYFETGKGRQVYQWLKKHAGEYGFCQTYTPGRDDGYNKEEWHWSYIPLAKDYLENFRKKITYEDIKGFEGSEYATSLKVIKRFVLNNINREC